MVAAQPATPRYVICNADQSDPGTFKDRQILAAQPHLVLERAAAMLAVGTGGGRVFIRHEYGPEERVIRAEIEHLLEIGLIGPTVLPEHGAYRKHGHKHRPAGEHRGFHLTGRLHPRRGVSAA